MIFVTGCAAPAAKYDASARRAGLTATLYQGAQFHHKIYTNAVAPGAAPLHVFIEGDVSVKQARQSNPPDPTPRTALMLRLMLRDPDAAILLGRPCAHGVYALDQCELRHIGPERYSPEIVGGMIDALRAQLRQAGTRQAVLFGHSGGGAIAMLMAARMPEITGLVTLAANLDNQALTTFHQAPTLTGSGDPADLPALPSGITQLHFFGGKDTNIPPALAHETLRRQGATPIIVQDFDHACCWEDYWPQILTALRHSGSGR